MASAEEAAGAGTALPAALPYLFFAPLLQLLAAEGDDKRLAALLDLPRGDTSDMAALKRACGSERPRLEARLATLSADSGGLGAVLRCRAQPRLLVMPCELLRLAVFMSALTVYASLTERRGAVSADAVSAFMSAWVWMPEGKGKAPWGAVAATTVAAILDSLKAVGSHSVIAELLRGVDTELDLLRSKHLLFLTARLSPKLLSFDSDARMRLEFAEGRLRRSIIVPKPDVHLLLRGCAMLRSRRSQAGAGAEPPAAREGREASKPAEAATTEAAA